MKNKKTTITSFILLIIIAAVYRIIPGRPYGFAPQIAMALFAGSVIADKKTSFLLPLLSLLISDSLYQILYLNGLTPFAGFYSGQITNYILFTGLTVIGFFVNQNRAAQIIGGSLLAATVYFIASNFLVWFSGGLSIGNLPYPKNWSGLMECYAAGIPFFINSIYATLIFSGALFGIFYAVKNLALKKSIV